MAGGWKAFWVGLILFPVVTRFVNSHVAVPNAPASPDTVDALSLSPAVAPPILAKPVPGPCLEAANQGYRRRGDGFRSLTMLTQYESGSLGPKVHVAELIGPKISPIVGGSPAGEMVSTDAECRAQDDRSRSGTPLPTSSTVDSVEECCTACDDAVGCVAWNFETATGKCNHLDTVSDSKRRPGFRTGTTVGW